MLSQPPLITLTTDFGRDSHYVAQMKGVILGLCRQAQLVDISHQIAPQDVAEAAWVLGRTVGAFPEESCHLAVVDPGVGTERSMVLAKIDGRFFIAPDNGLLWPLTQRQQPEWVRQLTQNTYWAAQPSATFHGRDIMAHVAGYLAAGVPAHRFGPEIPAIAALGSAAARQTVEGAEGHIAYVDRFGNLITNIPGEWALAAAADLEIILPNQGLCCQGLVTTYAQRSPGEMVALVGSSGDLEIAVVNGSAANRLQVRRGDPVLLRSVHVGRQDR